MKVAPVAGVKEVRSNENSGPRLQRCSVSGTQLVDERVQGVANKRSEGNASSGEDRGSTLDENGKEDQDPGVLFFFCERGATPAAGSGGVRTVLTQFPSRCGR